jgi:dihydrofolate reductase
MRVVTYGAACSLDGFIADRNGGMDWLHFSNDVQQEIARYWKTVDAVLMGRKTWAVAESQSASATGGGNGYGNVQTYVFSRTLERIDRPGVTLVSEHAGEFVRQLKGQPGRGICLMGGGELARSLFEAGVIDEVGFNMHPVLLGAGVPLFRDVGRRIRLTLSESRVIDGGCILATYRVTG